MRNSNKNSNGDTNKDRVLVVEPTSLQESWRYVTALAVSVGLSSRGTRQGVYDGCRVSLVMMKAFGFDSVADEGDDVGDHEDAATDDAVVVGVVRVGVGGGLCCCCHRWWCCCCLLHLHSAV